MSDRGLTRREFLRVAATTAAATGLAACAGATPSTPAEAPKATAPAAAEKKVQFWSVSGGSLGERIDEVAKEVSADSAVNIEVSHAAGGWKGQMERLNAAIAAGTPPELAHVKDFRMWDYAWRDAVISLDDYYAASDMDTSGFRSSVWDAMHYRDTPYGVPWLGSFVWVMFINDAMFENAGLDPATDVPTTWDELVEVSRQFSNETAEQYGHAFYELGTREVSLMLFSTYVGQAGGRIFNEEMTAVTLSTPEAEEALQWMYDMMYTWKAALPAEQMGNKWELVYNDLVGTWHVGPWFIDMAESNAPQLSWSLHEVPCHKECDNADTPECLIIAKDVEDPDAAWQAVELLVRPEHDLEFSALVGALPAFKENLNRGVWASNEAFRKYAEIGNADFLRPRQWIEGYEEVSAAILPELEAVWFDQQGVKEGLVAAEQAGNETLRRIQERSS